MKLYLHIGTPKTGTSTIQEFLWRNRPALARQGYLYPASVVDHLPGQYNHNPLVFLAPQAVFARLRRELSEAALPRVILSAECLQNRIPDVAHVQRFKGFLQQLGFREFEVVVYLREPAGHYLSMRSQSILIGRPVSAASQLPEQCPEFRFIADHRATLQRWGQVFGYEHLQVRLYEREAWVDGDLVHDFLQTIGLGWRTEFELPQDRNPRLNLLQMELLRAMNAMVPGEAYVPDNLKFVVLPYLRANLQMQDPSYIYAPPPHIIEAWRAYFADGNEWVRQRFFPRRSQLFTLRPGGLGREQIAVEGMNASAWAGMARLCLAMARDLAAARRQLQAARRQLNAPEAQAGRGSARP